jgi:hypothetical protein
MSNNSNSESENNNFQGNLLSVRSKKSKIPPQSAFSKASTPIIEVVNNTNSENDDSKRVRSKTKAEKKSQSFQTPATSNKNNSNNNNNNFENASEELPTQYVNKGMKQPTSSFIPTETTSSFIPTETTSNLIPTETTSTLIPTETTSTLIPTETTSTLIPTETTSTLIPTETTSTLVSQPNSSFSATQTPSTLVSEIQGKERSRISNTQFLSSLPAFKTSTSATSNSNTKSTSRTTGNVQMNPFTGNRMFVPSFPDSKAQVRRVNITTPFPAFSDTTFLGNTASTSPQVNPFAGTQVNPFAGPQVNPFAGTQVNPFAGPQVNPFAGTQVNPFAGPTSQQQFPFGIPQVSSPPADFFAFGQRPFTGSPFAPVAGTSGPFFSTSQQQSVFPGSPILQKHDQETSFQRKLPRFEHFLGQTNQQPTTPVVSRQQQQQQPIASLSNPLTGATSNYIPPFLLETSTDSITQPKDKNKSKINTLKNKTIKAENITIVPSREPIVIKKHNNKSNGKNVKKLEHSKKIVDAFSDYIYKDTLSDSIQNNIFDKKIKNHI